MAKKPAYSEADYITWFVLGVIGAYLYNFYFANSRTGALILGFLLLFVVPGYAWGLTLVKSKDALEKFVLSSGVGIALVVIMLVFTNLVLRLPLTQENTMWQLALLSFAGLGYWKYVRR